MTHKLDYDKLPVVPSVIADTVARTPYTPQEWGVGHSTVSSAEIEALRREMDPFQIREFADLCEARCKAAFDAGAEWFRKIATAKGDQGRDQLYIWTSHWLVAYLKAPDQFRRDCGALPPGNPAPGFRTPGKTAQSKQVILNGAPPDLPKSLKGKNLIVVRVPLEIIFSADPEELAAEERTNERPPDFGSLKRYIASGAVIVDWNCDDYDSPRGCIVESAALKMSEMQAFKP